MVSKKRMQRERQNRQLATILLIGAFFLSACSSFTTGVSKRPEDLKTLSEARELISILENQNLELKAFKGVGRITFWKNKKKDLVSNIAWVASAPDRLRVALRSVIGQPIISFASDGQFLYLLSHAQGQFHKQPATNSTLKKLLSVPIKTDDIVDILAGRVPVNKHNSAVVIKSVPSRRTPANASQQQVERFSPGKTCEPDDGYVLVLKKGWGNIHEKIYLDANKKDVRMVEVFGLAGALKYRVEFSRMQKIKGYKVPFRLVLSNDDGSGFQLDVDRFWADVSVSSPMFVLIPPE
jgi:outer membrane biogenesis lipoprotein LolB